ncbi:SIR2 family protein [Paenibacillus sp. O199]|uniref:SIR2 family protein n=1 Tax=Paenibacillus sp. O199 TaxID=1643925 RepID=UPI0007BFA779|nr:SIR2 family protein [Paenibacillus sp. O199]
MKLFLEISNSNGFTTQNTVIIQNGMFSSDWYNEIPGDYQILVTSPSPIDQAGDVRDITNYDNGLEMAFEEYAPSIHYHKIADVQDIASSSGCNTQIIKFHGDMETKDESSIVLTESSFFDRLDFASPLDIKFRSEILGESILFLGYSLNDFNIRVLLYKLNQTWKSFNSSTARPPELDFD